MKFFCIMKIRFLFLFLFVGILTALAQTKVSGYVFDEYNEPVSYANVIFKGSTQGTITNEEGRFYLESQENWDGLTISFIGIPSVIQIAKSNSASTASIMASAAKGGGT